MNYFILFLSLVLFSPLALEAKVKQLKKSYFRHLVFEESLYSFHKGIHPISENEAAKTVHYRFDYDGKGRVVEISRRLGDKLVADNGNWDSFTWWASKVSIEYLANEEIHTFYNHFDEVDSGYWNVEKAVFQLDSEGKKVALKFTNERGNEVENHWNVHRYSWEHVGEGTVIERRYNLEGEAVGMRPRLPFYTVKLIYGDDKYLDFMHHIDESGKLQNNTLGAAIDRIVYDQHGNFIRWMVYDEHQQLVEGNTPQLALGEHLYDKFGNKVGLRGYDVQMNLKAFPSGMAEVKLKYDHFGNLIEEAFYKLNKELLLKQVSVYSKNGQRKIASEFRDEDDKLLNHRQLGYAQEKISYNRAGRVTGRVYFTADGNEYNQENAS